MCFSAQADVVGGIVVGIIGLDVVRHAGPHRDHMALATLPLLLGAHQLDEAFVWWGLQGHVGPGAGRIATWVYLYFAFVVLPIYLPVAVMALEPPGRRRQAMGAFAALGAVVSGVLLAAMLHGPVTARLAKYHLSYGTGLHAAPLIVSAYVVATCGALILSSYRHISIYGIFNLVAVAILAGVAIDGLASLWCAWAAISSAAIAAHLRFGGPRRSDTPALA